MDDVSLIDPERRTQLSNACAAMKAYCKKLVTGEAMICQSNRYKNLFSASQLSKMVHKFEQTLECIDNRYHFDAPEPNIFLNDSDRSW